MEEQIKKLQQRVQELENRKGFQLMSPVDVQTKRIIQNISKAESKIRVHLGADQAIPDTTLTRVNFNVVDYDGKGEFSDYKFTASQTGYYWVMGNIEISTSQNADDSFGAYIKKNGEATSSHYEIAPDGNLKIYVSVSDILLLDAGDYVELYAIQFTGASESIVGGDIISYMTIHKLS